MTDEVIDLHQMIIGLNRLWVSANNGNQHLVRYGGNGNNITQHNGITKRENPLGKWGDAEFKCIGSEYQRWTQADCWLAVGHNSHPHDEVRWWA
jgi:hypothetical protein